MLIQSKNNPIPQVFAGNSRANLGVDRKFYRRTIPPEYATATSWKRDSRRKVIDGETTTWHYQPTKRITGKDLFVKDPADKKTLIINPKFNYSTIVHRELPAISPISPSEKLTVEVGYKTQLFHISQTEIYEPSEYDLAVERFFRLFCQYRDRYIRWDKRKIHWITRCQFYDYLTDKLILEHIAGKRTIGVYGDRMSQIALIDNDYHPTKTALAAYSYIAKFKQIYAILRPLGWFVLCDESSINGVHFCKIFDSPRRLSEIHDEVAAKFTEMNLPVPEIFPSKVNGYRLPLGPGRTALLDKPLDRLPDGSADLVTFFRKLGNPKLRLMGVRAAASWIKTRLRPELPLNARRRLRRKLNRKGKGNASREAGRLAPNPKTQSSTAIPKNASGWKGKLKSRLIGFWENGDLDGVPLNEHLLVRSRFAHDEGLEPSWVAAAMKAEIRQIKSFTGSNRLQTGNWTEVDRSIDSAVKRAWSEPLGSFQAVLSSGLRSFDLKTWFEPVNGSWLVQSLTPNQRTELGSEFAPLLKCRNQDRVIQFVCDAINLGNDLSIKNVQKLAAKKYSGFIKLGMRSKALDFVGALERLGLIYRVALEANKDQICVLGVWWLRDADGFNPLFPADGEME